MRKAIGRKQQKIWDYLVEHTNKLHHKWRNTLLSQSGIGLIQEGIMYIYLIYAVLKQGMSIANFMLYIGSIRSFNQALIQLLERWMHMVRDSRMLCDFREFLEYPERPEDIIEKSNFKKDYKIFMGEEKKAYSSIIVPEDKRYEFRFEQVFFSYPGSEQYVLKNLNLTLKAGERLAVVGLNGAGKSTFIMLLCRLYEPTKGTIYMNGQDISKYKEGKTAVYISHRLSSCKFCDRIAVFSDQTIKEYGSHEELITINHGIYAQMFEAQAQYYA